jgi:hypothetical protein
MPLMPLSCLCCSVSITHLQVPDCTRRGAAGERVYGNHRSAESPVQLAAHLQASCKTGRIFLKELSAINRLIL